MELWREFWTGAFFTPGICEALCIYEHHLSHNAL